jgi:hypothetical protein
MCANRAAIYHRLKWRIATSRKGCGELLPQCTLAPAAEPIEHRGSGNIFGGQRTPAQALAKVMQIAADGAAIIQALLDSLNQMDRSRRDGYTP